MWWTNQQNNWDDRVIPADVRPSLPWDQLPVCEVWTKQGLRLDAGSNEPIILLENIIIHIWCILFGKFSSRWSTSLVSTGDFSSSRPLENLSLPESLPRWELLKLTKHITKPNIPEYSLPRLKLEHSKLILNIPVVLVERQRQVVHAQLRPWLCSVECHGQHHYYQT